MTEFTVTLKHVLTERQIASLLCSAFEGGVGYWFRIMAYDKPTEARGILFPGEEPVPYTDLPLQEGGAVIGRLYEEETDKEWNPLVLNKSAIEHGLVLLANKYPKRFQNLLENDTDAEDGDVFVQLALLGEVRYG